MKLCDWQWTLTHLRSGIAVIVLDSEAKARRCFDRCLSSGLRWDIPSRLIVKTSQQHRAFWNHCLKPIAAGDT